MLVLSCTGTLMAETVSLPQTGQTSCWDSQGELISCAGTMQDGAIKAGVAWPNPRFKDNGNRTVTDNLTGLVWPKDTNVPAVDTCKGGNNMTWQAVLDYVKCLNSATYLGHTDWRLPNVNELESLVNAQEANQSAWLNVQMGTNVEPGFYWSCTTNSGDKFHAWYVDMGDGSVSAYYNKESLLYVWPVRSGQSGAFGNSLVWSTGQTTKYAEGDDGALRKGMAWPKPRFKDNGNQTVTDNLTGLVWSKDAGTPTVGACKGIRRTSGWQKTLDYVKCFTRIDENACKSIGKARAMNWQNAMDYIGCLNGTNYLGRDDWRLPNRKELMSLVDRGGFMPPLPSGHPFKNVQTAADRWYVTSTTSVGRGTAGVWFVYMSGGGYVDVMGKHSNVFYVWPVSGRR
ncbi:protein containing DUF1566 [Candidatus Magnetobacterium bavaricum]|uniref:Protein containing DUF1566 n=1 Tax=Candidatus Magnetobacterium bavaricum TaxID=29290 RepID=A0A0F3GPE2_9BACT|nr:protein containing DUF1566 [Candidatus Magnetobacterium bavaricum]